MTNMVCIVSTDLPEERGYVFRGIHSGKIEAILGVKQRAGFAVDSLVSAEELRGEILSSIAINPGINTFLVQQDQLIYLITNFAGKAEEVGQHVALYEAVDASFAVRISQRLLIRWWVAEIVFI